MQPLTNQAQQTIAFQQQRLSPYVPFIAKALIKTYGVPLACLFTVNFLVHLFSINNPTVLSGPLGQGISLGVFFVVLFVSWRFSENRWNGRTLLVVYSIVGKARRLLQSEIDAVNPSDAQIQDLMSEYVQSADHFIATMNSLNIKPKFSKVD